jgi:DNA-binding MarR family transcriptional regulator
MKAKQGIYGMVPIALLSDPTIKPNMLKVYIALASFQGGSDICWPSLKQIAGRSGLSVNAVSDATGQLETTGWISKARRASTNKSNIYEVMVDIDNLSEQPIPGKPVNRSDTDSRKIRDTDSRKTRESLYMKRTKENNNSFNAVALPDKTRPPSPMRDSLAQLYQESFAAITPMTTWSNVPRERANLNHLAKLTRSLAATIGETPERTGQAVFDEFYDRVERGTAVYWNTCPFLPSGLIARWGSIVKLVTDKEREAEQAKLYACQTGGLDIQS